MTIDGTRALELHVFDETVDALRSFLDDRFGPWQQRAHRYGVKLWFGAGSTPDRCHYEAQVIGPRHLDVDQKVTLAIEVGFHAEHPKAADNEAVMTALLRRERRWRKALGPDAVAGPFLGRDSWRRLSEVWLDPDLGEDGLGLEIASRLTDYVDALEPLRPR